MMGCRWSATRGMMMLLGLLAMVLLIGSAPAGGYQPPRPDAPAHIRSEIPWQKSEIAQVAINNLLDDFHDAAAKSDFDRYFKHWSPVSVFLGTDATERWVGQEFKDFARPYFDKGKGWTYRPHDRHIQVAPSGEAAFFDELLDNDKLGLCRGSGVLRKMDGEWWLMQYNLSIPVPNELAERVVGIIRAGAPKAPDTHERHQE